MRAALAATLLTACAPPPFELTVTFDDDTIVGTGELRLYDADSALLEAWPVDANPLTVTLPAAAPPLFEDTLYAWLFAVRDDGVFLGTADEHLEWSTRAYDAYSFEFTRDRGWNVVEDYVSYDFRVDTHDLGLPLELTPSASATLGGAGTGEGRLALAPLAWLDGAPRPEALLYDAPRAAPWAITLTEAPPADHVGVVHGSEDPGTYSTAVAAAVEVPVIWTDADGDGALSALSEIDGAACAGSDVLALVWIAPATDPSAARTASWAALGTGWRAVRIEDGLAIPLSDPEDAAGGFSNACLP